jgi:ATP adenylyltransferase
MQYVSGAKPSGCIFCHAQDDDQVGARLVLHRGEHGYLIMNLFPYNSGHMMAVPNAHVDTLEALPPHVRAELMELTALATEASRTVLRCDGFNLGTNIGAVAGAGIAAHLHLHIVPRWIGDANFMPIVADTMVMPELLEVTHAKLRAELETIAARRDPALTPVAGAIVYLPEQRAVVMRRSKNGDIVVPKGHIEAGEAAFDAALREVNEETGYLASVAGWVGSEVINVPKGERQHVVYLLALGTPTDDVAKHLGEDVQVTPLAELPSATRFASLNGILARAAGLIEAQFPA